MIKTPHTTTLTRYFICLFIATGISVVPAFPGNLPGTNRPAGTLSGTYTVGAGGNYLTLTAAIADYNSFSLAGPVVFSLLDASYSAAETFPIAINNNTDASAINTLTIRPAGGVNAVISGLVNADAMFKVRSSYVIIDGSNNGTTSRNLTFTNTGNTSARTIMFGSTGTTPVTNGILKNCNVLGGSSTSNAVVICDGAVVNSAGYFNNITIENNLINKSFYGIYCNAVVATGNGSGLLIRSNDLSSTGTNAIQFAGIFIQGVDGGTASFNTIGNFISTDATTDCGIWLSTGTKNVSLLNNTITNLTYTAGAGYGSRGIYVSTGVTNTGITVAGNMIANITGDGDDYTNSGVTLNNPVGLLMVGPQTGIKVYHNSIFLGGVSGATNTLNRVNAMAACVRIYGSGTADVRNNILVNNLGLAAATGYGSVGVMVSNSASQLTSLDYNDYSINPAGSGVKVVGMIASAAQTTLAGWKTATGKDAASVNVMPVFVSSTNLHLVPGSNPLLSNATLPISGYTQNDIDNATRNPFTPDMGCDEFVEPNTAFWIGKTSTAWLTASNWEANAIPDGTTDVLISGGYTYLPVITTTQAIRALTMTAPGVPPVLTLNSGTLQINGAINCTSTGSIDGTNGTVEMNGTIAQTIPTGLFINNNLMNLVIGNSNAVTGVSLNGPLNIYESVTFSASGLKLTTNDFLVFKSTALQTARLGNVTGKTIVGNATVERYIPAGTPGPATHGKSWQLLAVPVSGTQTVNAAWQEGASSPNANPKSGYGTQITGNVAGALGVGFDVYTAAGASMKTYDAATGTFIGIPNTNSLSIANQKGYMVFVRGDRSVTAYNQAANATILRTTGKLYTTGADLPPSTNVPANKFESVGNPYASAIDFTAMIRTGGVDNTYYVWDPLLAGTGYGGYQTISAVTAWLPSPGGTINYPSGVPVSAIQSGQAFFVHTTGATGTVSFTEAVKIAGSKTSFRENNSSSVNGRFFRGILYAGADSTTGIADGNIVAFDDAYSNAYDANDALKFANSSANFGILRNGQTLAVEARSSLANNDTIFYTFTNLRKQAYLIRLIPDNMMANGMEAWLEDGFLHTSTLVSLIADTDISFSVTDDPLSAVPDRFRIIFKQSSVLAVSYINISATRTGKTNISVKWQTQNETDIEYYEVQRSSNGQQFEKINQTTARNSNALADYQYEDQAPFKGMNFYRIRSIDRDGKIQYSTVIKVADPGTQQGVSIYPNPLVDKKCSIAFANQPAGEYKIQVTNIVGQVIYSSKINVNADNFVQALALDKNTAPGNYTVTITSINGSVSKQQVIVQ